MASRKINYFRLLSFVFFFSNPFGQALAIELENSLDFQQKLDQVNSYLRQVEAESGCPGVELTLSCGDGKCSHQRGENEMTCPEDCVIAAVKSYDSLITCSNVTRVLTPANEEEIQTIIKDAAEKKQHIRVIGNTHTVNTQYCTQGVVVSAARLNQIIGLKSRGEKETVVVQAGVTLKDLTEWLDARGKSLGYAVMGYGGMTLGGVISTGSHGSSPSHTTTISSLVRSLKVITPEGHSVEISEDSADPDVMEAYRAHLGLLGVIVEIELEVVSQFNLHVQVSHSSDEKLFNKSEFWNEVSHCDFAGIDWFPHTGKFIKICGVETQQPIDMDASNVLLQPQLPSGLVKPIQAVLHYGACSHTLGALLEDLRYEMLKLSPPFQKKTPSGRTVVTSNLVGPSHRMMVSPLSDSLKRVVARDWEFAVPLSEIQNVIRTLSDSLKKSKIYLPVSGVFFRFGQAEDSTLLAHSTTSRGVEPGDPIVYIEIITAIPVGFPAEKKQRWEMPYDHLFKNLMTQYHAKGHWGKNKDWVFQMENDLGLFGHHLERFKKVRKKVDPEGLFTNEFSRSSRLSD